MILKVKRVFLQSQITINYYCIKTRIAINKYTSLKTSVFVSHELESHEGVEKMTFFFGNAQTVKAIKHS